MTSMISFEVIHRQIRSPESLVRLMLLLISTAFVTLTATQLLRLVSRASDLTGGAAAAAGDAFSTEKHAQEDEDVEDEERGADCENDAESSGEGALTQDG